jgi:hypothetical protein
MRFCEAKRIAADVPSNKAKRIATETPGDALPFGTTHPTSMRNKTILQRRHPDSNRGMRILQTLALPLGHVARHSAPS